MGERARGDEMNDYHVTTVSQPQPTIEQMFIEYLEKRRRLMLAEVKDIEKRIELLKKSCYNNL